MTGYQPVLRIDGVEFPVTSHRGISMAWASIDGVPKPRRDDNWRLRPSAAGFVPSRLFAASLTGSHISLPPSLYVGQTVVVDASAHRSEAGFVDEADLPRPAVLGSVMYFDADGALIADPPLWAQAAETRWHPKLVMTVMDVSGSTDSFAATASWSIALEETAPPA